MKTAIAAVLLASPALGGLANPFTEGFDADSSNWRESDSTTPLAWSPAGSFNGSPFASGTFNFVSNAADDTPAILRGHDSFDSSDDAFVGNWVDAGVTEFTAFVRHDAPVPLNYFVRFASPANFPAAAGVSFIPVAPNTWTPITISVAEGSPQLVFEGPFTHSAVFSNIGNVQIGVSVPQALAGVDQGFTFDVDNIGIAPSPSSLALLALAGVAIRRRR